MSAARATERKTQRIAVRATASEVALLRRAVEAGAGSLSGFMLRTAVVQAERDLADRRWFVATPEQYDDFMRLLDAPMDMPKLRALFAEESPVGKPVSPSC